MQCNFKNYTQNYRISGQKDIRIKNNPKHSVFYLFQLLLKAGRFVNKQLININ